MAWMINKYQMGLSPKVNKFWLKPYEFNSLTHGLKAMAINFKQKQ